MKCLSISNNDQTTFGAGLRLKPGLTRLSPASITKLAPAKGLAKLKTVSDKVGNLKLKPAVNQRLETAKGLVRLKQALKEHLTFVSLKLNHFKGQK